MARQHGYKGQVSIDPTGGTTYVAVGSVTNFTFNATRERADGTAFGDSNKVWLQGLPNYSGDIGFIWDSATTPTEIFDVVLGDLAVGLKLTPSTLTPTVFFSGPALIDATVSVNVNGAITGSGTWVASGAWTVAP